LDRLLASLGLAATREPNKVYRQEIIGLLPACIACGVLGLDDCLD
jgi:hypothetical protein